MKKSIRLIALILSILTLLPATCSYNGYCDLPYPNFEMLWWPESLLDVVSIGGSIYFASGDASINMLHLMYALYFNKDLLSEFRLDDPVYLVRNHKWTLDALN
jgi:ABC-type glycerol-3-phosphate transport system substrate-binding protein